MSDLEALTARLEAQERLGEVLTQWCEKNSQNGVALIAEIAALSQTLMFFGSFIEEIAKLLPPGSLAGIINTVERNMDPEQRDKARVALGNLALWRNL